MRSARWRTVVSALLLAIVIAVVVLPGLADTRPACVRASEWVAAHAGSLPRSAEEIAALPAAYRSRVFASLDATTRSGVVRAQLAQMLRAFPELTPTQTAFIRSLIALATPDLYASEAGSARVMAMEADARRLFTSGQLQYMTKLGVGPSRLSYQAVRLTLQERLHGLFTSRAANGAAYDRDCNCNMGDSWCCDECSCLMQPGYECTPSSLGCGWFLLKPCNGECYVTHIHTFIGGVADWGGH
jgi:hypothetical protein